MSEDQTSFSSLDAETVLQKTFQSMSDSVVLVERKSRKIVLVNPAFEQMFGYSAQQVIGKTTEFLYPDEDTFLKGGRDSLKAFQESNAFRGSFSMSKADGTIIETHHTLSPIYDEGGTLIAAVSVVQDRTEWLLIESALKKKDLLLSNIADNLPGAIYTRILRPDGKIEIPFFKGRLAQVFGIQEELLTTAPDFLFTRLHPEDSERFNEAIQKSSTQLSDLEIDLRILDTQDNTVWLRTISRPHKLTDGSIQWDAIGFDVTGQYEAEAKLDKLYNYDHLTGLPNRKLFHSQLESWIQNAEEIKSKTQVAVITINLDRFKFINSSYGMEQGDFLLMEFAERLRSLDIPNNNLARLVGDQFAIMLKLTETDNVLPVLTQLKEAFEAPFLLADDQLHITASIGVAVYPDDSSNSATLIQYAESALHTSRNLGGSQWTFYSPGMSEQIANRVTLERQLREAIDTDQLIAYYQPQVDPLSCEIVGLEALVRWQHPHRGTIYPNEFIPIAEESDLICELGQAVLKSVCKQYQSWKNSNIPQVPVSINISAKELNDQLYDVISNLLSEYQINPSLIELEVTEGLLIEDPDRAQALFQRLGKLGLKLALDDFGTGYSALSYLQRFKFEKLKIDRAFVQAIAHDKDQEKLVKAIISMADSFHMKTVAEGVETQEQLRVLIAMGCTSVQGWVYSKAVSAEETEKQLLKGRIMPADS